MDIKNLTLLFTKVKKREERRNHGSYKYPHSLHNVTAKQIDEKKERTEAKENERDDR